MWRHTFFELTARREEWPEDERAHILALFLTGPAQQASQDLTPEQASQYRILKQAVRAYYGHSLAARVQRFHGWRFDPKGTVRFQITQHARLIRRWLTGDDGPSALALGLYWITPSASFHRTPREHSPPTTRTRWMS